MTWSRHGSGHHSPRGTVPIDVPAQLTELLERAEIGLREPLRGVTSASGPIPGLFTIERTDVSTAPLREAAIAFVDLLDPDLRTRAQFPVDSDAWRRWCNMHPFFMRHGVCLEELDERQIHAALSLMAAALSEEGFVTARDIMRLNETLRELTGSDDEYGEWLYWVSIMGTPSEHEPWGFQIDGHHLIVNCFVLGDQVVMTPMFIGSEPTCVESGKFAGTRVFMREESTGLALAKQLSPEQFDVARLSSRDAERDLHDLLPGQFRAELRGHCLSRTHGFSAGQAN